MILRRLFYCYQSPQGVKYKIARGIFPRKQEEVESVDSYIVEMQKSAKIVGLSGDTLQLTILNGLQYIQNCVLQKEPKTLQDLIFAARLAQLTISATKDTDVTLHAKLDELMKSLEDSERTAALVQQRDSPKPKRVSFG